MNLVHFYVGGKYQDKQKIKSIIETIQGQTKWTCSFVWPDYEQREHVSNDELQNIADMELNAVLQSDVCFFIFDHSGYTFRGTLCEMAVATVSEKCKYVYAIMENPTRPTGCFSLGSHPEYFKSHIFLYHKKVQWIESVDAALKRIVKDE